MSTVRDTKGRTVNSSSMCQVSNETTPAISTHEDDGNGIMKILSQSESEANQYKSSNQKRLRSTPTFRNGSDDDSKDEPYKSVHVQFSKITFREHPVLPSDNPSVTEGPPVGLEWNHQSEYSIDVDQYESKKMPRRSSQLKMPSDIRTSMLKEFGHSWTTIHEATKQAKHDRKLRGITMKRSDMNRIAFDEKLESFGRRFKTPFRRKKSTSIDTSHLRDSADITRKGFKDKRKTTKVLSQKFDPLKASASGSANNIKLDSNVLDDSRDTDTSLESKGEPLRVTKLKSKSFLCNNFEIYE